MVYTDLLMFTRTDCHHEDPDGSAGSITVNAAVHLHLIMSIARSISIDICTSFDLRIYSIYKGMCKYKHTYVHTYFKQTTEYA